jgi:DNA replication protein DnaC
LLLNFNYFDKIAKVSLIILDDFGLTRMEQQQQFDLMEIIEDRHGKASLKIQTANSTHLQATQCHPQP